MVVLTFPQLSLAEKVTVADPVIPQSSESELKSLFQVTSAQLSVADAPPFDAIHACSSSKLPDPSHSTVTFAEAGSIEGAVVS